MTLLAIAEWEVNSYNDSDWFLTCLNTETNMLERFEIGSTRYAGGFNYPEYTIQWTAESYAVIKKIFECKVFADIKYYDEQHKKNLDRIDKGSEVITNAVLNCRKYFQMINCEKCQGTGKWVNPRNSVDQRTCFACFGNGSIKGESVNKSLKIDAGMVGKVLTSQAYGKFYSNGYNKPDRYNTNCLISIKHPELGAIAVNAKLEKLELNVPLMTDDEIVAKLAKTPMNIQFLVGCHTWLSKVYIPANLM